MRGKVMWYVWPEDRGYPHSREARVGLTQPASNLRTEASPRLGPDTDAEAWWHTSDVCPHPRGRGLTRGGQCQGHGIPHSDHVISHDVMREPDGQYSKEEIHACITVAYITTCKYDLSTYVEPEDIKLSLSSSGSTKEPSRGFQWRSSLKLIETWNCKEFDFCSVHLSVCSYDLSGCCFPWSLINI